MMKHSENPWDIGERNGKECQWDPSLIELLGEIEVKRWESQNST
jgi:hypothetical protein